MKIRSGFVSNSSSSSFLILLTKEAYDEVISGVDPLAQAVVEQLSRKTKFLGTECVAYSRMSGNHDDFDWLVEKECVKRAKELAGLTGKEFDEDDIDWHGEIVEDFESRAKEMQDRVFTNSEDF